MEINNELLEEHYEMVPSLDKLISDAIMYDEPLIIVEGYDDESYYREIANQVGKQVNVKAIETIQEFVNQGGCEKVIDAINQVEEYIGVTLDKCVAESYILGIIDGDARSYQNKNIPSSSLFLILQVYSIECHFDLDVLLKEFIKFHTYVDEKLVDGSIYNFVKRSLNEDYAKLWYISLEALKTACDLDYKNTESLISYKPDSVKKFYKNEELSHKILAKKEILDRFAEERGLTILDIKKIAKGKWLLEVYIYSIIDKIKELHSACKDGIIKRCPFCITSQQRQLEHCQYRTRINFMENNFKSFFFQTVIRCSEVEYIYQRIEQLGS